MTAINTRPESNRNPVGARPHAPGALQRAGADWIEIPQVMVRRHLLSGTFFVSKDASEIFAREGLSLDVLLCWFNEPRPHVLVGDRLLMGHALEAFFGFDDSQPGASAFFVEISLRASASHHWVPAGRR